MNYSHGNGDPDCPQCRGRGCFSDPERMTQWDLTVPTVACPCTEAKTRLRNMEHRWKGLSKAAPLEETPLLALTDENLWITAPTARFKEHLRLVVENHAQPEWHFEVMHEGHMMNAWFSNSLESEDILDPEVSRMRAKISSRHARLMDLSEPAKLLIITLGVKTARNQATPEVVLEAIQHRVFLEKPTWVIDQPLKRLESGHLAFSEELVALLSEWEYLPLAVSGFLTPDELVGNAVIPPVSISTTQVSPTKAVVRPVSVSTTPKPPAHPTDAASYADEFEQNENRPDRRKGWRKK